MKKLALFVMVLFLAFAINAADEPRMGGRDFGLGLEFGDYPGIVMKLWVSDINSFSAGVGFGSFTRIHADFLWHNFNLFKMEQGRMPLYYGFGGIMNTSAPSDASFGVRGTIGLAYIFKENNVDIFFEVSPTFRFDPVSGMYLSGSVGARFFFL